MTTIRQEKALHGSLLEGMEPLQKESKSVGFEYEKPIKNRFFYYGITDAYIPRKTHRLVINAGSREKEKSLFIQIGQSESISIPIVFKDIYNEIEKSRYILKFEDDWDDAGSPKYDLETWKRAVLFLRDYSMKINHHFHKVILAPKIFHSINSSIDMLWKNDQYQLLINIPKDGPAKFYGDNYESNTVEGSFDPSTYSTGLMLTLLDQSNVA